MPRTFVRIPLGRISTSWSVLIVPESRVPVMTVPKPFMVKTRSMGRRRMPFDDLGDTSFESFASSWTSSGRFSPVFGRDRDDGGLFEEGAFDERADIVLHQREPVLVHHVHLGQDDQAFFDLQEVADGEVLARLGHDAFIGGDHEHDDIDAADAGKHVLDEPFMARHVHDAEAVAAGEVQGRESRDRA